jgi:hypothetical protein
MTLVLDNPQKYPVAWARAQEVMPGVRLLTLALPSEDELELTAAGLTALVTFSVNTSSVEYAIKVPWGNVVDMSVRTQEGLRADRGAVAKRKATNPAVKLLQSISTGTDLLSPEELEGAK